MKTKKCGCEKDVFACRKHARPETKAKHTQGPWKVTPSVNSFVIRDSWDRIVASMPHSSDAQFDNRPGSPYTLGCIEANARLIAAAPELLDALKAVLEILSQGDALELEHDGKWIAQVITKAEGK